jgi:hypothetical protein
MSPRCPSRPCRALFEMKASQQPPPPRPRERQTIQERREKAALCAERSSSCCEPVGEKAYGQQQPRTLKGLEGEEETALVTRVAGDKKRIRKRTSGTHSRREFKHSQTK